MLVQLAFSLICLALGASGGYVAGLFKIGWWLGDDADAMKARESLKSLTDLTARVTGQVEAHSRRVESAQQQLDDAQANEASGEEALSQAAESLRSANEQLQLELRKAKRDLEQQQSELQFHRRDARTDGLTQLLNRRAFDEEMSLLGDRNATTGTNATLLLLDIDHFKSFNDTYGHQLGDRVLRHVADTVRKTLSGMDVIAARYGGEEFAVILLSGGLTMAARTAEELRGAIEAATLKHEGKSLSITVSLGLSQSAASLSNQELIARSDAALYAAKRGGRNCGFYHTGEQCQAITALLARPARPAATEEPEVPIVDALAELEASLTEATAGALSTSRNRRRYERRPYWRKHLVGPIVAGRVPPPEMFSEVQFFDLSASGFGILLPAPPSFKNFIVALDKADGTVYALAEVVRMRRRQSDNTSEAAWEIGCRFMGKLQSPRESPQESAAHSQ